jgi:hypothetical protein
LEDRAKKNFEVKDDKLLGRPMIDHDIEGGGGKGKKNDSDSRSGAKKKFKFFG